MQYDIAYTRFAKIVTSLYDAGHYMLFDLSYWWWVLLAVVTIICYFVSRKFVVYETHYSGRLGGGEPYLVVHVKENVNPVVARIVDFIDTTVNWAFVALSVAFGIRLIISVFTWLFSPINV